MATITKLNSGNYRIRKTYNGKSYSATLDYKPTNKQAEKLLFEKISAECNLKPDGNKNMTIQKAGEKYIESRRAVISPTTIRGYYSILTSFGEDVLKKNINNVTKEYLQTLITDMVFRGLKTKSIKNYIFFLLSVIREERNDFNPRLKFPQKTKNQEYIPNDDDYSKLMEYVKDTEYEIAFYLAGMGLRRSEICGLSINDVSDDGVYLKNVKILNDKSGWEIKPVPKNTASERFVPLPPSIVEKIRRQGYIYKYSPGNLTIYIHKIANKIGIHDFSLHKLRHYFATRTHTLGIPDSSIMRIGGWKTDHVMKNIYRHADEKLAKENMKEYQKYISNLFNSN